MIGNTRQGELEEAYDREVGKARGVLRGSVPEGRMKHTRRLPAPDVAAFVAHYWSVSWDLREHEPHVAETLPHPNIHLVLLEGEVAVHGVPKSKFTTTLEGRSSVFGVKFRPGGFRPFYGAAVSKLAGQRVPAQAFFGDEVLGLAEVLLGSGEEEEKLRAADAFLRVRLPEPDASIQLASDIVEQILRDPSICTVDELAARTGLQKRSLQRLFSEYVGASPKWVIRRYRLHEALERLHAGGCVECAGLAAELGYFDQAHLINDFKSMVGLTPAQYQKLAKRQET